MNTSILVINPGSMTTRVSLFENDIEILSEEIIHDNAEIAKCKEIIDQLPIRKAGVENFIKTHNFQGKLSAIACRGAPLKPVGAGTYLVEQPLVNELRAGHVATPHVSMLAILIGWEISLDLGLNAYFTDPISVDEFIDVARLTGRPEIKRKSLWHALNCRAVTRRAAEEMGKNINDINALVAHMGSGITVAAFEKGKCIDACNANSESPFSPERSGTLPFQDLVKFCYSGKYNESEMLKLLMKKSGLTALLGTNDCLEIQKRIKEGETEAKLVYDSMIYNIAKSIGSYAPCLCGKIDAVILTGALARSEYVVNHLKERISFLGKIFVYPGQDEMSALAYGTRQVLIGKAKPIEYVV